MAAGVVAPRAILSAALLLFCASVQAYNYTYSGGDWPDPCTTGKKQSPIIISSRSRKNIGKPTFKVSYATWTGYSIVNTGHVIQLTPLPGSTAVNKFRTAKSNYTLYQFHFHAGGEHSINGETFAVECHFVHTDDNTPGLLAVLAVPFRLHPSDVDNVFINKFLAAVPYAAGTVNSTSTITPSDLFEQGRVHSYYTYEGSLTAPPCTEAVTFYVLDTVQYLSVAQLHKMMNIIAATANGERTNNRLPQKLNGRVVSYGRSA